MQGRFAMNDPALAELNRRLIERTQIFLSREVRMLEKIRTLRQVLRQCREALASGCDMDLPEAAYSEQARAIAAADVELNAAEE
jgi:hypothetical protein